MVRMEIENEEAYDIAYRDVMNNATFESQKVKMRELFILRAEHDIQRERGERVVNAARKIAIHFELSCAPEHYTQAIKRAEERGESVWISGDLMADLIQTTRDYLTNKRY